MEKLKLSELQKFILLFDAQANILSQGLYPSHFIHPYDCDAVKFNVGAFSRKNGCRVEVVYTYHQCTIRLLWHYTRISNFINITERFDFVPKAITIEREFKGSILISIVPDPDYPSCYRYQSLKSIYDLCEEDSEEGVAEDVHVGACLAEVDDDSTHSK